MTDIVKRLRTGSTDLCSHGETMTIAADEIERLRKGQEITDPTPAMIEAGAKVIAGVAYGDFAKTLAEDCYRAMREAKDQK